MSDRPANVRQVIARVCAVAGTILVWFPFVVMLLTGAAGSLQAGALLIDYLMIAEFFTVVVIGGVLVFAASFLTRIRRALVGWVLAGTVAAFLLLIGEIALTNSLTESSAIQGLPLVGAFVLLAVYSLAAAGLGVAGVLLVRDLGKGLRPRRIWGAAVPGAAGPSDRERWNERYSSPDLVLGAKPSAFLVKHLDQIVREAPGRRALDVACGEGRNSITLARAGFDVVGIDASDVALEKARQWAAREGLTITFLRVDLSSEEPPLGPFDVIIVFNYLQRELIPKLYERLTEGGFLAMESILATPHTHGRRRDFVVQPGELAQLFAPFSGDVIECVEVPAEERARIFFRKGGEHDADVTAKR